MNSPTPSYKYFGQEKGIVSYGFLDDRHRLFYSTTFSSSEREAAYLVDGLLHNDVVESTIHSTDTHGLRKSTSRSLPSSPSSLRRASRLFRTSSSTPSPAWTCPP